MQIGRSKTFELDGWRFLLVLVLLVVIITPPQCNLYFLILVAHVETVPASVSDMALRVLRCDSI
jgi:hypothetical protein